MASFLLHPLCINMRLAQASAALLNGGNVSQEDLHQKQYANMLVDVSRNRESSWCNVVNRIDADESTLGFPFLKYITITDQVRDNEALNWLYPNQTISHEETILCSNNESIDNWNTIIQLLNRESSIHTLYSKDSFEEVDDPNGYLRKMLTKHYLNQFHKNGIPHHKLKLKLGDVCLVTRAINGLG
jgi:hypothetical protein